MSFDTAGRGEGGKEMWMEMDVPRGKL